MKQGALFTECRKYRYRLWRIWDESLPLIMFIGLNPSRANETRIDPTVGRVIQFSKDWGYGGVYMMNLFSLVSPYPKDLLTCENPVQDNNRHLLEVSRMCEQIIFSWGNFKESKERAAEVKKMFPKAKALLLNKDGTPRHPLYVPSDVVPINYQ